MEAVPCNSFALETISQVKKYHPEKPIDFRSEVTDDFCIRTNHLYLMRSLRELLYNAAKYSDGQHITVRIIKTDSNVRFIVEDKGNGIAEADRDRIFESFTKVDDLSEGLGLGLPLSKHHIRNLGGDLTLDADYQDGCRFIIELPISQEHQA
jgi:signal transduction histidine kinase